jgi:hypothetical protein
MDGAMLGGGSGGSGKEILRDSSGLEEPPLTPRSKRKPKQTILLSEMDGE